MNTRETLKQMKPYVPGKSKYGAIKLSSNENPLGPSPQAIDAIKTELNHLHRYPDGESKFLKSSLASHLHLKEDNFIIGNGSDEILAMIAATFLDPEDQVISAVETFSEYTFSTYLFDGQIIKIPLKEGRFDLQAILKSLSPKTKIIFIANPNNPTGTILEKKEITDFLADLPQNIILVLDEAYGEFSNPETFSSGLELIDDPRVIITKTFSKIYGLAGLRVGYGVSNNQTIAQINRTKQAFNVNTLAQISAAAALKDKKYIQTTLELCQRGKSYIYQELDKLNLFYYKSEANFICISLKQRGEEAYDFFLERDMAIRSLHSFGMPYSIRYTLGTDEQNEDFISILKQFILV